MKLAVIGLFAGLASANSLFARQDFSAAASASSCVSCYTLS
jgi:hypothetical protein